MSLKVDCTVGAAPSIDVHHTRSVWRENRLPSENVSV